MPHIKLEEHLPGITGLLEYRRDTAEHIRNLTMTLMRGESTLTFAERELIATVVSSGNKCQFCTAAHTAITNDLLGENNTCETVLQDYENSSISKKMKALISIATKVQQDARNVNTKDIERAVSEGATELEIHDTVLIAALFCLYNKYVDGLGTIAPSDPQYYKNLGDRIRISGYQRNPEAYEQLKSNKTNL